MDLLLIKCPLCGGGRCYTCEYTGQIYYCEQHGPEPGKQKKTFLRFILNTIKIK